MNNKGEHFTHGFFFGNYFYGICVALLAIEANVQLQIGLNQPLFYIILALGTIIYYTHAYRNENQLPPTNPRIRWYQRNFRLIRLQQFLASGLLLIGLFVYLLQLPPTTIRHISPLSWALLCLFPAGAILYNTSLLPGQYHGIRWNGWIKPFIIGFIWAGVVTFYPPLFRSIDTQITYQPSLFNLLLFIKNGMYIGMLCILFDIKDYAADHNQQLKTFVVRLGLRKTLFRIIIPLTCLGFGIFLLYGIRNHFPLPRLLMNSIPFLLLITVTYHMHRRKSILYYLAIIDGLMLVKACCGIAGSLLWH